MENTEKTFSKNRVVDFVDNSNAGEIKDMVKTLGGTPTGHNTSELLQDLEPLISGGGGGSGNLPDVTAADAMDVLQVSDGGEWAKTPIKLTKTTKTFWLGGSTTSLNTTKLGRNNQISISGANITVNDLLTKSFIFTVEAYFNNQEDPYKGCSVVRFSNAENAFFNEWNPVGQYRPRHPILLCKDSNCVGNIEDTFIQMSVGVTCGTERAGTGNVVFECINGGLSSQVDLKYRAKVEICEEISEEIKKAVSISLKDINPPQNRPWTPYRYIKTYIDNGCFSEYRWTWVITSGGESHTDITSKRIWPQANANGMGLGNEPFALYCYFKGNTISMNFGYCGPIYFTANASENRWESNIIKCYPVGQGSWKSFSDQNAGWENAYIALQIFGTYTTTTTVVHTQLVNPPTGIDTFQTENGCDRFYLSTIEFDPIFAQAVGTIVSYANNQEMRHWADQTPTT